jgi:hypothetical protein
MKHFLLIIPLTLFSVPTQAQQVNNFGVCTQYQEVYVPGGYDQYGNYYSGGVQTQSYNVPCNRVVGGSWNSYGRDCNPVRTLLGATLGGAIGRSMTSTPNNRNNRGWATALGASLGGLAFAC